MPPPLQRCIIHTPAPCDQSPGYHRTDRPCKMKHRLHSEIPFPSGFTTFGRFCVAALWTHITVAAYILVCTYSSLFAPHPASLTTLHSQHLHLSAIPSVSFPDTLHQFQLLFSFPQNPRSPSRPRSGKQLPLQVHFAWPFPGEVSPLLT